MTGLTDTDIRLGGGWQLTRAADGDAPLCANLDCLLQNIALEAETQAGDLFYDPSFGWSMYDFIQNEDDELTRLEIISRVREKLRKRQVIRPGSIAVEVDRVGDVFKVCCSFQLDSGESAALSIVIGAVSVEVVSSD